MARAKQDAECMLCGEVPCVCGKPSRPAPKVVQPKSPPQAQLPSPPAVVPPAPLPQTQPRTPVVMPQAVPTKPPVVKPTAAKLQSVISDEEAELRYALTALAEAELLHPDEIRRHRDRLDLPPWKLEALIWKAEPLCRL